MTLKIFWEKKLFKHIYNLIMDNKNWYIIPKYIPVFILYMKFCYFYSEDVQRFILINVSRKKCRIIVEKCSKKSINFSVKWLSGTLSNVKIGG